MKINDKGWILYLAMILFGIMGITFSVRDIEDKEKTNELQIHYYQTIMNKDNTVIVIYDEKENQIEIKEHNRRDTLVCMRGQCKLVEEWVGK